MSTTQVRLKNIKSRLKSDNAASSTVEFMFISLIIIVILVTVIDIGVYFINRTTLTSAAQSGARIGAVYGGNGVGSPIAAQYGVTDTTSSNCVSMGATGSPVACSIAKGIHPGSLINAEVNSITCSPTATRNLGERVECIVNWRYENFPLSLFSPFFDDNYIGASAQSEVVVQ